MLATNIRVAPGLALPFFPMRPAEGRSLSTPDRAVELVREFEESGDTLQPKLNGDRACVAVVRASHLLPSDVQFFKPLVVGKVAVLVQNRHGDRYHYSIANLSLFARLPPGTCQDGEVFKKQFYPFETLASEGISMLRSAPDGRVANARAVCRMLGVDWLFDAPKLAYLRLHRENLPFWEGIVRKAKGSPYVPCTNDTCDSPTWWKHKWS